MSLRQIICLYLLSFSNFEWAREEERANINNVVYVKSWERILTVFNNTDSEDYNTDQFSILQTNAQDHYISVIEVILHSFKDVIHCIIESSEISYSDKNINKISKKQLENTHFNIALITKNQLLIYLYILAILITITSILLYVQNRKVRLQNAIIQEQMQTMQKILDQKQVLLKELQHRVKNNLQHVISILEIQKESLDFSNIEEVIRENQNRIHSMALLHSKLDVVGDFNMVNLKEYLTDLSRLVKDSYDNNKNITVYLDCKIEFMSIKTALPLGMIVVELISNSIKHAFENLEKGLIIIELSEMSAQKKHLHYWDNGVGFNFDQNYHKGVGIEIITGLIDQLNGTVETDVACGFDLKLDF